MSARNPVRLGVLLAAAVYSAAAGAAREGSLEYRVERIEALMQSQGLIDMLTQLQQLQREVRQLRGEIEVQGHRLEQLQQSQRDMYLDIDRRLGGQAPTVPPTVGAEPSNAEDLLLPPGAATPAAPAAAAPSPVQQAAVASPDEQAAYEQALNLLREGRYDDAAQAYHQFLSSYPNGRYADNAQYWLAESRYVTRQYAPALEEFAQVPSLYPNSAKVPDALLKMGFIHYEMGNWREAREQLDAVAQRYPESTAARLANERLQRMTREGR
ncbi:MAG: tol-pal system protein YbgF [Thiohalobacteraceae bacterium]